MPLRYAKSKRPTNKKRYYKRVGRKNFKNTVAKKPTFRAVRSYGIKPDPFPQRLHTRVKYAHSSTIYSDNTVARIAGTEQVFRLSSIYDCNYTAASNQTVVGWSDFANLYKKYIVKGAKIEVSYSNPEVDGMVAFCSLNQTTSLTGMSDKNNYENSLVYSSDVNNTGSQTKRFNFYVKPWAMLGLSKLEWKANRSGLSSALAGSPTEDILFRCATSANTTPGKSIHLSLRIIYYVEFFERSQLSSTTI